MLLKARLKLIEILAGNEPVILNWMINPTLVKDNKPAVYIPMGGELFTAKELGDKGVLTPIRNVKI